MRTAAEPAAQGAASCASRLSGPAHAVPEVVFYLLLAQLVACLLDLFVIARRPQRDKDLEIVLLRQQMRILQRQHPTAVASELGAHQILLVPRTGTN